MKRLWLILFLLPVFAQGQIISTYAGNGIGGITGDGGTAANAELVAPMGVKFDKNGDLLISTNGLIRKVNTVTNIISTIAGDSTGASNIGNGGPAINALIDEPRDIYLDALGNIFIADFWAIEVRKINIATGIISSYAGTVSMTGSTGDGGPATNAKFSSQTSICIDTVLKVMYIADEFNYKVRKIDMATGIITTFAGTGVNGYLGDDGPASSAELSRILGLGIDVYGNLYIGDCDNARIRKVDAVTSIITTIAGSGVVGFSGDDSLAINAKISGAYGICFDKCGNLFFSDFGFSAGNNHRIRRIDAVTGIITTVAGNGSSGFSGDGGPATNATISRPWGLCIDKNGSLYFADIDNNRVRKVTFDTLCDGTVSKVNAVINIHDLNIYPNPATTELNISALEKITTIAINNLLGQTIYTQSYNSTQIQIDVANLPKGIYFIKINGTEVRKFVKE